jgi:DNA primase
VHSNDFQSERDRVRDATDLVRLIGEHIALKPKGREHVGLCPFHDDHKPSFAVVSHKGHAFYKCFSCGASGDCFRFVMDYHKMSFGEAIRYLAEKAGITLNARKQRDDAGPHHSRTTVRDVHEAAVTFYERTLKSEAGAVARQTLEKRGVTPEMVKLFRLGAAPDKWDGLLNAARKSGASVDALDAVGLVRRRPSGDGHYDNFRNRLMFPIFDDLGRPIAFGARQLNPDDDPKYLNSSEHAAFNKSATLYAMHLARRAIVERKSAIVTEGYMDAIACHQAGFSNTVATLGTSLTIEHAAKLKHLCDSVTLVFDADEAGMRAADRAVQVFFSERLDVRICVLPDELDPDELLLQEGGRERFQQALDDAADALTYRVDRFRGQLDKVDGLSARQRLFEQFMQELSELGFSAMQGVRKRLVMTSLADLLGLSVAEVERALPRSKPRSPRAVETKPALESTSTDDGDAPDVTTLLEEAIEISSPVGTLTRARQIAEQELLAILLYDSAAAAQLVRDEHGHERQVATAHPPASFIHPALRRLAELVYPWIDAGENFSMQRVLGELAEASMRRLASALFEIGERRCGGGDTQAAREAIIETSAALLEHARVGLCMQSMDRFSADGADGASTAAVTELLERRRKHGMVSMAIARGVRNE